MPIPKKPKSDLASEHILGTLSQKKAVHGISKRERKRVSQILAKMINSYIDENYSEDHPIYKTHYQKIPE
jgi:hypothetical protein